MLGIGKEKTREAGGQVESASNKQNWWTRWGVYFLVPVLVLLLRLPILHNNVIFIDEPIYLVQAKRIFHLGEFIYSFEHLAETKFQFSLVTYVLALRLNQEYAVLLSRIMGVIALTVSGWLIIKISREFLNSLFPALFTFGIGLLFLMRNELTTTPLLEHFQLPWLLLSLYALLKSFSTLKSNRWLFLAGVALGIAGLVKVNAWLLVLAVGVQVAAIGIWLSGFSRTSLVAIVKKIAVFSLGLVLPIAAVLLPYVVKPGGLGLLQTNLLGSLFNYATYNRDKTIFDRGLLLIGLFGVTNLLLIGTGLVGLFWGFIQMWRTRKFGGQLAEQHPTSQPFLIVNRQSPIFNAVICAVTGATLLISFMPGQAKEHYLLAVLPFLTLAAGYGLLLIAQKIPGRTAKMALVAVLAVWLVASEVSALRYYAAMYSDNGRSYNADVAHLDKTRLANYIKENSRPEQSLWVYYNYPELYLAAQRAVATTEPSGNYLVDFYNETWFKRTVAELEVDKPAVIVGVNRPHYYFTRTWAVAVIDLPFVGEYIAKNYTCDTGLIPDAVICKRK